MLVRYAALFIGLSFTAAGIGGFIPGITTPPPADAPSLVVHTSHGLLLGLFPVNIIHNLIHLSIGIGGLIVYRDYAAARRFVRLFAIALTVLTVMGLVPALHTTLGFVPVYGHAIWLHGLEALISAYIGFFAPALASDKNLSASRA